MLDFSGAFSGFSGSSSNKFTSTSATFTVSNSTKAYYFNVDNIDFTESKLGQALLTAISGASSSISSISVSSSGKAIFALNNGADGNAYLFSVSASTSTGISNATVKLLAVVDDKIDNNDIAASGGITFA